MNAVKEATKIVDRYVTDQQLIKEWFNNVAGILAIEVFVTLIVLGIAMLIRM